MDFENSPRLQAQNNTSRLNGSRMIWWSLAIRAAIFLVLVMPNGVYSRRTHRAQSFKISPKPCRVDGEYGTCMFVWECVRGGGRHLGMCVDDFMFGTCCTNTSSSSPSSGNSGGTVHFPTEDTASVVSGIVQSSSQHHYHQRPAPLPPRPTAAPHHLVTSGIRPPSPPFAHFVTSASFSTPFYHSPSSLSQHTSWSNKPTSPSPSPVRTTPKPSGVNNKKPSQAITRRPATTTTTTTTMKPTTSTTTRRPPTTTTKRPSTTTTRRPHNTAKTTTPPPTTTTKRPSAKPTTRRPPSTTTRRTSTTTTMRTTQRPNVKPNTKPMSAVSSTSSPPNFITRPGPSSPPHWANRPRPPNTTTTKKPTVNKRPAITTTKRPSTTTTKKPAATTKKPPVTTTTPKSTTSPVTLSLVGSGSTWKECGLTPFHPRPETRIVGGKNAAFGGWPWQVSVRRTSFFGFSSTHRCGGAVLNENWIATAGHCVDDLLTSQIRIRVGEHDFSTAGSESGDALQQLQNGADVMEPLSHVERGVARKVVHPRYNFYTYEYDLALVRLSEPLPPPSAAPHVAPICLPGSDDLLVGENATVTGWGRLSEGGTLPSVLQQVTVPIVSNEKCKSMFLRAGRHEFIPDIFLCAGYEEGGRDSCQGDSGGPLQVRGKDGRYFLAGIISWGIGCAEANLPGVCTRISKFTDWILENVT